MAFKPAIASMSLGRAWVHDLAPKFQAAAAAGLPGIEIFFEDLVYYASSLPGGPTPSNHLEAAHYIRSLANSLNLELIACGPFSNCEGVVDGSKRNEKIEELHLWFQICHILGTDIIQIPCTFQTEGMTGDIDAVVRDLQAISDLGAQQSPPFRFAFENLCFGAFFDTWEKAWEVVRRVDRPNFGWCLDTYNIAGREYGDPSRSDGVVEGMTREKFQESMRKMARTIEVEKVFYVQVVDAERLRQPLDQRHAFYVEGQKPRMSWSRNARLFICEEERGGYLPVMDVVRAITSAKEDGGLGYQGWISMELFNRSLTVEGEEVPREHAERAMQSWRRLEGRMGWCGEGQENKKSIRQQIRSVTDKTPKEQFNSMQEVELVARL